MSDRFENRLRELRDTPLPVPPDPEGWKSIEARLRPARERPQAAYWRRYGWLLILLLVSTCGVWSYRLAQNGDRPSLSTSREISLPNEAVVPMVAAQPSSSIKEEADKINTAKDSMAGPARAAVNSASGVGLEFALSKQGEPTRRNTAAEERFRTETTLFNIPAETIDRSLLVSTNDTPGPGAIAVPVEQRPYSTTSFTGNKLLTDTTSAEVVSLAADTVQRAIRPIAQGSSATPPDSVSSLQLPGGDEEPHRSWSVSVFAGSLVDQETVGLRLADVGRSRLRAGETRSFYTPDGQLLHLSADGETLRSATVRPVVQTTLSYDPGSGWPRIGGSLTYLRSAGVSDATPLALVERPGLRLARLETHWMLGTQVEWTLRFFQDRLLVDLQAGLHRVIHYRNVRSEWIVYPTRSLDYQVRSSTGKIAPRKWLPATTLGLGYRLNERLSASAQLRRFYGLNASFTAIGAQLSWQL